MASKNMSFLKGFAIENDFDAQGFHKWMSENGASVSWTLTFMYVTTIFGIKKAMEKRKRFDLRFPLVIWSTVLAIFSICGAVRSGADLYYTLQHQGFRFSMCDIGYTTTSPIGFWCSLFAISKGYELGDTIFIVLRKQQLIFLHWYHHITVMLYVFNLYVDTPGTARWFMTMNYIVHSFMYTYYSLRALRYKIPRQVNLLITLLQLSQMVIGFCINILAYKINFVDGNPDGVLRCHASHFSVTWGFLMYISYFILFANFFYNAYLKPKDDGKKSKVSHGINGHTPAVNGELHHKSANGVGDMHSQQNGEIRKKSD